MLSTLCKDPYRIFFPLAIACLIYASGLWIAYGLYGVGEFPVQVHANLFLGGFLFFSILGFLLTAIPRFTQTQHLSKSELFLSLLIIFFVILSFFLGSNTLLWGTIFSGWLFFFFFAAGRFIARAQNPPFSFIFVGLGAMLGLIGSFSHFLASYEPHIFGSLLIWGKIFFYDAMVMSFIIGIGGRLIPGILGLVTIVEENNNLTQKPASFLQIIPREIFIILFMFILSLILEGLEHSLYAYILRAIVISFVSFRYWKLHIFQKKRKWHGTMIKLACWHLLLTSWILCFFPDHIIHMKHIIYIGSYVLLTMMISSRVILAHSSASLDLEFKIYPYVIVGGFIAFAAATRVSAIFIPNSYVKHLGYAGIVLLLGGLVWILYFFKHLFSVSRD